MTEANLEENPSKVLTDFVVEFCVPNSQTMQSKIRLE